MWDPADDRYIYIYMYIYSYTIYIYVTAEGREDGPDGTKLLSSYGPKKLPTSCAVEKYWKLTELEQKQDLLWTWNYSQNSRQNMFFLFLGSKIWFPILCALAGMWALYTWWSLTRMCLPALVARNRPKTHIWLLYGYYWCRLRSFRGNHQNGLSGPFPSFLATCDPLDPCCDFFLGVFELCFHFKSLR